MTKQQIADRLKELTVNEYEKDPKDRDWFGVIGELIDELMQKESQSDDGFNIRNCRETVTDKQQGR
jgi:hypothetical protein